MVAGWMYSGCCCYFNSLNHVVWLVTTSNLNITFPHFHSGRVSSVCFAHYTQIHSVLLSSCSFIPFYYGLNFFRVLCFSSCEYVQYIHWNAVNLFLFSLSFMKRYVFPAHKQHFQCNTFFFAFVYTENYLYRQTNGNRTLHTYKMHIHLSIHI